MQKDSRNLLFAIALSLIVMLAWQYFVEVPKHKEAMKTAEAIRENKPLPANTANSDISPGGAGKVAVKERDEAIKEEGARVTISNNELHGSLALKGARFDDITLANYKQTIQPGSPEVVLLSPSDTESFYFGEFGWLSNNKDTKLPDSNSVWKTDNSKLEPGKPVTLSWDNGQGLTFKQVITLDENYMFKVTQTVENNGSSEVELMPYGLLNRTHKKGKTYYILHEGPLGVFNHTLEELTFQKLMDDKKTDYKNTNNNGWLGITDKYWLTAIIPEAQEFDAHFAYSKQDEIDRFQVDYLGKSLTLKPGEKNEASSYFFAGAKEVQMLDNYAEKLNIPLFDRAIDFGWYYFLTKPLFYVLKYLYAHVGNFGIAIILLTFIVKLIMFPLANKSYKSMGQMKALQPEIAKLRERYKDDKLKLNQEVMDLYKREKVKPLAGCLPMFIQIPVFFSLYKVFFVTIEMRHAPFFGWIHDLSAPDPTSVFNLFGLLPWTPPAMLMIGVLPILYGSSMFLQQRLSPAPADPAQAQMMKMLPIILTFVFASFPAGLVLYWVSSNVLSILQQWLITAPTRKAKES